MLASLLIAAALAEPPPPPVASEMQARMKILAEARDAVIEGRLAAVGPAIAPLASPDPMAPFPAEWRPMLAGVEAAAGRVGQEKDLAGAAQRVSEVAVACSVCHGAVEGGPGVFDHDIPPQEWQPGANMPLHRWSVEWMWLGLLSGSEEAWDRGAQELDGKPIAPRFDDAPASTGMAELEQRVYALAKRALAVQGGQAERAEVMGELLATCAACHAEHRPQPAEGPQPAD